MVLFCYSCPKGLKKLLSFYLVHTERIQIRIHLLHHLIRRMAFLDLSFPKEKKYVLIVWQIWEKASEINREGRRRRGVLKEGAYSGYLLLLLYRRTIQKRSSWPRWSRCCNHWPRVRHSGMWSQVGLRRYHYEQSYWKWWNSNWAISNPERWCCESAALNMPPNLENSAGATGLEKVSFHSNLIERQCQRMLKLPHNCTHPTRW